MGNILDETDNARARKTEPGFGPDGAADVQPLDNEMGELPAWLKHSVAHPAEGGRWKQAVVLWGGSLVTLAVVFAGALWLFDEHNNERAMAVVARSQPPAAPAAPTRQSSASSLPPLVLLAPAPEPAAKISAPVPVAAVPAAVKARTKAPVARIAAKAPSAKPAGKPLLAKAPPPRKTLLAKSPAPQPKAKSKKPLLLAKHTAAPAKAKPRMLASALPAPAKAAQSHRCQPGELARDCANRP